MAINPTEFVKIAVQSPNNDKKAREAKKKHHCDAWRKSGLSMTEYCRRNELGISTLSQWVKKYDKQPLVESKISSEKLKAEISNQSLEIVLASGIRLRFGEIANIKELLDLIKALERCS